MKLQTTTTTTTTTNALKVRDFNELLSCQLCDGYLINPTTVDNCLHTFCRSCIVQHLQRETCCPQCKIAGAAKQINVTNLRSDDVLRALIFKLIPGLYQKERERTLQFKATQRNGQQRKTKDGEDVADGGVASREQDMTIEENFFAPTEPISLSLEYHPALLKGCSTSQIPPVRYLQCPAGLKIRHLKRFLCSKFDIDPESKRIEVEVIYEDEVLPNDFTLMDVGYCYNWKRHAPMKFTYRILFYGEEPQIQDKDYKKSDIEKRQKEATPEAVKATEINCNKEVNICDETSITTLTPASTTSLPNLNSTRPQSELLHSSKSKNKFFKSTKIESNTKAATAEEIGVAPVKMIIARKSSADSGKKPSPKRNGNDEATYAVSSNDFKSLRSNDIRYSDYAVSSTTSNSNSPKSSPKSVPQRSPKTGDVAAAVSHVDSPTSPAVQSASAGSSAAVVSKCEIVVSIPQSQMPKSPYSIDDEFENVSLAQLKTASKKSPPSAVAAVAATTTTVMDAPTKSTTTRNVPKLKIELNSLKTRLSISKPKSAGVLQGAELAEKRERVKQRKRSLDEEPAPLTDHLDIETYAKNIGLQPIEVLTPPESADAGDKLKYSPNASPLSSASSTTSSSNNAFPLGANNELTATTTTSFHKKRKKKHSKDSKDSKDSKRRRMHAEISSKPEEESLKMKVKLTPPHQHKSHRSEMSSAKKNSSDGRKACVTEVRDLTAAAKCTTTGQQSTTVLDNIMALNKTLGEESRSINHLMKDSEKPKETVKVVKADETLPSLPQCNLMPKPVNIIKDTKLPASPPLPPSLFKTTPLNFNTLTVNNTSSGQAKHASGGAKQQTELGKMKQILPAPTKPSSVPQYGRQNSLSAAAMAKSHPNFIVPSIPRRPSPGTNTSSYTPSSIASSSNKQMGLQLKRSASLDEHYALGGRAKQPKLDAAQRKSLYNSYANKPFASASASASTTSGGSKVSETVSNAQGTGVGKGAITIATAAQPSVDTAHTQSHWQLPPYTQLQLPFSKPAVEIVRINSQQTVVDIPLHTAESSGVVPKGGRMMGPPLSMVKGKKVGAQQSAALSSTGSAKSPPIILNAGPLPSSASSTTSPQARSNNSYRLSPPALVNLSAPLSSAPKKTTSTAADTDSKKHKTSEKLTNSAATEKQLQQHRNSLRDFRPMREHIIDIVDITGSGSGDKDEVHAADTTISTSVTTATARDSLEATLNKIKQNISSSTSKDQQKQSTPMQNDDLQNLHLLSESATAREKIAIRGASQTYEKSKMQQSTLVRQQNASVRNIPNPSALAFRNMSTLPPTVVSSTPVTVASNSSTTPKINNPASSTPTQIKPPLPLTTIAVAAAAAAAPLSPGNILHSTTTTNSSSPSTTAATRTVKKPTTIDQVAANLNMRASAAAAEAHAAKLNSTEDAAQISSSTNISATTTAQGNKKELTKAVMAATAQTTTTTISTSPNTAASSTTPNVPSVGRAGAAVEIVEVVEVVGRPKEGSKRVALKGGDEGVKAKVLPPKSKADSSGVTTTIDVTDVTDGVTSIKNVTNNNNNNNNSNNNNNNNSNSKNNNTNGSNNKSGNCSNGKFGVTTASGVASD